MRGLRSIEGLAEDSSQQLRDFLWVIAESCPTWEDLGSLLRRSGYDQVSHLGVNFELRLSEAATDPEPPLQQVRTCLYRVFREALTNVIRHSRATTVTVALSVGKKEILLEIQDNGDGFDPEEIEERRRGLKNMERRAEELRGALAIQTGVGRGVRLELRLPRRQDIPQMGYFLEPTSVVRRHDSGNGLFPRKREWEVFHFMVRRCTAALGGGRVMSRGLAKEEGQGKVWAGIPGKIAAWDRLSCMLALLSIILAFAPGWGRPAQAEAETFA